MSIWKPPQPIRTPGKWGFPKANGSQSLEGPGLVKSTVLLIFFILEKFCLIPAEELIKNTV